MICRRCCSAHLVFSLCCAYLSLLFHVNRPCLYISMAKCLQFAHKCYPCEQIMAEEENVQNKNKSKTFNWIMAVCSGEWETGAQCTYVVHVLCDDDAIVDVHTLIAVNRKSIVIAKCQSADRANGGAFRVFFRCCCCCCSLYSLCMPSSCEWR